MSSLSCEKETLLGPENHLANAHMQSDCEWRRGHGQVHHPCHNGPGERARRESMGVLAGALGLVKASFDLHHDSHPWVTSHPNLQETFGNL